MSERQTAQGFTSSNAAFTGEGALKLRLDTQELLNKIELFLSGKRLIITQDEQTGEFKSVRVPLGTPRLNDQGLQDILNYIGGIVNPSAVQGNFNDKMFNNYIYEVRTELNEMIFNNIDVYGIDERNYKGIIDFIVKLIEPYMSRTINDGERKSYGQTIKTTETATLEQKKGIFPF